MADAGRLTVGLDVGSSSTKVVAVDESGHIVKTIVRPSRTIVTADGRAEHDASVRWWEEPADALREATNDLGDRIDAVAVSGIGPCVLVTAADGTPLHPAILYGVDTRATSEIDELNGLLGRDRIGERCGSELSTQAGGPKLRWLASHRPDIWTHARRVYTCSSFMVQHLTGEYRLDHHTASQYTPLYDIERGTWIDEWWDECARGIDPPVLAWSNEVVGTVTPAAAEATGLPVDAPVTSGTVDAWAEAVSVGARFPGDLMLMYGSTFFLIATTSTPVRHPALWTTASVEPGTWSLAGGMASSGSVMAWWADTVGAGLPALIGEAERSPPGANGLLALPYFAGERTPIADPAARGVIAGLSLEHRRGDILRALLEATAFAVRHNLEAFADSGLAIERVRAVGGGAGGSLWPKIVSDVTGCVQQIPVETVGAAYGDAALAAEAIGRPAADWAQVVDEIEPIRRDIYEARYASYRQLYESTRSIVHQLPGAER